MSSRSTSAKNADGAPRGVGGIEMAARSLIAAQSRFEDKEAPMPFGLAGRLLAGRVRASAARTGFTGMAGGLAFNYLLRRSPLGAAALGAVIVGRHILVERQAARDRKAERQARKQAAKTEPKPTKATARP